MNPPENPFLRWLDIDHSRPSHFEPAGDSAGPHYFYDQLLKQPLAEESARRLTDYGSVKVELTDAIEVMGAMLHACVGMLTQAWSMAPALKHGTHPIGHPSPVRQGTRPNRSFQV